MSFLTTFIGHCLLVFAMLTSISFTGCSKSHTCECEGGKNGPQTQTIEASKEEAEERCNKSNIEWSATGGSCKFKK